MKEIESEKEKRKMEIIVKKSVYSKSRAKAQHNPILKSDKVLINETNIIDGLDLL